MSKQKNKYKGKFIIAFDTICDGWQCATDDKGKPAPTLFNNEGEAMKELFDDAISMFESQTISERKENGVNVKTYHAMKKVYETGNPAKMAIFLENNPNCNYNDEFIVPAESFVFGRKAIFTGKGLQIIGEKLK